MRYGSRAGIDRLVDVFALKRRRLMPAMTIATK
jgi:hypothetical protein